MRTLIRRLYFPVFSFIILLTGSCKKQDQWLSAKSDKSAVIPSTITDLQGLLDYTFAMNYVYPTTGLVGADNSYIPDASFALATENERNIYTWNAKIWSNGSSTEWNNLFKIIEIANVVLDAIGKINADEPGYRSTKGQALFHRAFAYYHLAQVFCKSYNPHTETADLGLPIRLTSEVKASQRASLKETYDRIIADAKDAAELLPVTQPYLQRPVNAAAYALLAKTHLNMGNYAEAKRNADAALAIRPDLVDYNGSPAIVAGSTYRFNAYARNNNEVLFYASGSIYNSVSSSTGSRGFVAPDLYSQYQSNDLRKTIFYVLSAGNPKYRGAYTGNGGNFCGIATNEVYLIRAECLARSGQVEIAIDDLNKLLSKRYKTGTFVPIFETDAASALSKILIERRKELPFVANIRWEDLKRLNLDPLFQTTLSRTVNGITYSLPPNDKRYVLPIPDNEIQLTGIKQNER